MKGLPIICIFGKEFVDLKSGINVYGFEADELDCRFFCSSEGLPIILASNRPQAIVSFGDKRNFPELMSATFDVRRKWIHFDSAFDLDSIGPAAFSCFLHAALDKRTDAPPIVSVFTPAYCPGKKIMRPFHSLLQQTYPNWEWIIVDDSDDGGRTFRSLRNLAKKDHRIRLHRTGEHSGVIGQVKRTACMLAEGEILVELDHDDALTDRALDRVVNAFKQYPQADFVYSDWAECFENGAPVQYPDGWGHGYGSYRLETYRRQQYLVANAPHINAKTIRHIVGAPNHLRAWRRDFYIEIGGHNPAIHVADDYELIIRTFLNTQMAKVPEMCYIQHRNADIGNTHQKRNREIQRLVRSFSQWYENRIHERLLQLGVDDFVRKKGEDSFWRLDSAVNPATESHCTLMADL